jgi:hypothetical protein
MIELAQLGGYLAVHPAIRLACFPIQTPQIIFVRLDALDVWWLLSNIQPGRYTLTKRY